MAVWKCTECGSVAQARCKPGKCAACGALKDKLTKEEAAAPAGKTCRAGRTCKK